MAACAAPVYEEEVCRDWNSELLGVIDLLGRRELDLEDRADSMNWLLVLLFDMSIIASVIEVVHLPLWLVLMLKLLLIFFIRVFVALHSNITLCFFNCSSNLFLSEDEIFILLVQVCFDGWVFRSNLNVLLAILCCVLLARRLHFVNFVDFEFLDILLAVTRSLVLFRRKLIDRYVLIFIITQSINAYQMIFVPPISD